jgi:hypothetical protein
MKSYKIRKLESSIIDKDFSFLFSYEDAFKTALMKPSKLFFSGQNPPFSL